MKVAQGDLLGAGAMFGGRMKKAVGIEDPKETAPPEAGFTKEYAEHVAGNVAAEKGTEFTEKVEKGGKSGQAAADWVKQRTGLAEAEQRAMRIAHERLYEVRVIHTVGRTDVLIGRSDPFFVRKP